MSSTSPARLTTFTRDGLTFDVLDEGPIDGEVVVLLHGFPQLNTSWSKVAPQLHAEGYRTLAPNQRGYSPGARPRGRRAYRASELAADVIALIDRVGGGPVHLVGHDWGAAVAWAVAINMPDRVRTLTSVSVPHPGAFLATMRKGQALHSWYMLAFNIPWLPERVLASSAGGRRAMRGGGMSRETYAAFRRDFDRDRLRGGLGWYRALPLGNPGAYARHCTVPTTHVWSDGDVALVRAGAELTAQYVDADYRLEVLDGVSHWIPDDQPERLAEIILERMRTA
jgi:pimeloyl-ACP methyl ester carboxylesterase